MSARFEELDFQPTPIGDLVLRRRLVPMLGDLEVFEVKLGDDFLMSSLFHEAEVALADLSLAGLEQPLDVVVGGLGLGYTAAATLKHDTVRELIVIDALEPVIKWHRQGMVPLGRGLADDPRCRLVLGDFFALARDPERGFDPEQEGRKFDAILLDIDHSPDNLLNPENGAFYTMEGLRLLGEQLKPGGVFGMWSDDAPDDRFLAALLQIFGAAEAKVVSFPNPLHGGESASTVYVSRKTKE